MAPGRVATLRRENAQQSCVATRAIWECSAVACARGFPLCLKESNNPSWRALIIEKVFSPLRLTFSLSVLTRPRAGRVGAQRLRVAWVYPNEYSADAWSAPPRHTCGICAHREGIKPSIRNSIFRRQVYSRAAAQFYSGAAAPFYS